MAPSAWLMWAWEWHRGRVSASNAMRCQTSQAATCGRCYVQMAPSCWLMWVWERHYRVSASTIICQTSQYAPFKWHLPHDLRGRNSRTRGRVSASNVMRRQTSQAAARVYFYVQMAPLAWSMRACTLMCSRVRSLCVLLIRVCSLVCSIHKCPLCPFHLQMCSGKACCVLTECTWVRYISFTCDTVQKKI